MILWRKYFQNKYFQSITASIVSIGLVKLVAFYKEIVVAATLSVGHGYDLFLFYLALIGFPTAVLLNPLQSVFIKKISRLNQLRSSNSKILEKKYTTSVIGGLMCVLPIIYIMWFALFEIFDTHLLWLFRSTASSSDFKIWGFAPYAVLTGLNIMLYGYLQAKHKFFLNGILQILTPLSSILFLFTLPQLPQTLLLGISVGAFCETIILLWFVRKYTGILEFNLFSFAILNKFVLLSLGLVVGFLMTSITPLIESFILFSAEVGDMSSYSFASKFPLAISSVLVTTSAIVALPVLSKLVSTPKNKEKLRQYFITINFFLIILGICCAYVLSQFSADIIRLIYAKAHFDYALTDYMGKIQSILFYQIPFAVISIISVKALVAVGKNFTISIVMSLGAAGHALFLILLSKSLGAYQIALFSTVSVIAISLVYFIIAIRQLYWR